MEKEQNERLSLSGVKPTHILTAKKFILQLKKEIRLPSYSWVISGDPLYPYNMVTGRKYSGANFLAILGTHSDPRWLTAKQAERYGWAIREGERGTRIQLMKDIAVRRLSTDLFPLTKENHDIYSKEGVALFTDVEIFNFEQIDFRNNPIVDKKKEWKDHPFVRAENLIEACGVEIRYNYRGTEKQDPEMNFISMPLPDQFRSRQLFYAYLFHKLYHWANNPKRLNLFSADDPQDIKFRIRNDMRAELTCMFISRNLDMPHHFNLHAGYIKEYIEELNHDPLEIHLAAVDAERATAYLMGFFQKREQSQKQEENYYEKYSVPSESDWRERNIPHYGRHRR